MKVKATIKTILAVAYKNRAKIETIAGMVLIGVGTGVIISKAREAAEVSYEVEGRFNDIHRIDAEDGWESKKERSKEVRSTLKYAAAGYAKTYGLAIGLELVGGTLIAISDITQAKELSATSALLATTSATLSAVKQRVIEDQGEEKWQEYLLGPQFTTVDVMPDGTVVQTTEPLNQTEGFPPHCFFFDEVNCPDNWEKDPLMNRDFLENHLRWLNERLWVEGFLFENDIRRDIGAPIVKSGWTSGIFATDKDGNRNYLKFGLDAKNERAQAFRDGREPSILIQLNVEDNILDQLKIGLI